MNALESPLEAVALNNYVSVGLLVNNIWTWVAVVTAAVSFWSIRVVAADLAKSSDQTVRCGKPYDHHVSESDQPNYKDTTTTTTIITTLPDHQKKPDTRAASNSNSVSSATNMMMRSSSSSSSSWCVEPTIESSNSSSSIELGGATRGRKFSVYNYYEGKGKGKGKGKGEGDELGGIDSSTSGTGGDYDDIIIDEYDDDGVVVLLGEINTNINIGCDDVDDDDEGNWEFWNKMLKLRIGEMEMGWYSYQDLTLLDGNVVRLWDSST